MYRVIQWYSVIAICLFPMSVLAKPYVPVSEGEVVRVFVLSGDTQRIKVLRNKLRHQSSDYKALNEIVSLYLKMGREKSDPRYFGYAEAILSPYLKQDGMSEMISVHWADILQHRHDFDQALVVLNSLADKGSDDSRVYLMRAIIHISRGEYGLALNSCKSLISRTSHLLTISCVAQVKSLSGSLRESFDLLERTLNLSHSADAEEQSWALTLLADMALRLGEHQTAEIYFKQGLKINHKDYYLLANYTDLLLKQHNYARVISLLSEFTYVNSLLLRLTLAYIKTGSNLGKEYVVRLDSGYRLNELRGEKSHLRDQAIFYYKVKKEHRKALELARTNWKIQKEPEDTKLFLNLAIENQNEVDVNNIIKWLSDQRLEDLELKTIVSSQLKKMVKM